MQKIPQKIVVLFAIVKISDIFSAYFFVNFCLKIWKNYTRWKKIAKFYGNIYYCKFFWEILPIFRWKILHFAKKSLFFTQNIAEKYSMQKLPQTENISISLFESEELYVIELTRYHHPTFVKTFSSTSEWIWSQKWMDLEKPYFWSRKQESCNNIFWQILSSFGKQKFLRCVLWGFITHILPK